jgi:hypothetical protein
VKIRYARERPFLSALVHVVAEVRRGSGGQARGASLVGEREKANTVDFPRASFVFLNLFSYANVLNSRIFYRISAARQNCNDDNGKCVQPAGSISA